MLLRFFMIYHVLLSEISYFCNCDLCSLLILRGWCVSVLKRLDERVKILEGGLEMWWGFKRGGQE